MSIKIVKATQNLSGVLKIWENHHQIDITIRMVKFWKIGQHKWKMTKNFKKPSLLQKKIKHMKELKQNTTSGEF